MVKGKMFYSSVLAMSVCLFSFSCKGAERNRAIGKDTSILALNEQSFTIEIGKPFYQATLISSGKKLSGYKKVLLLLDHPVILQNPDGVYEVYISPETNDVKMLSPSHPGFINVLDLYALTVSEPPNYLSIDLSKKSVELAKDGQPLQPLNVTILFRGNGLPGNVESKKAGQMTVKGIRVIQEN
jgi:hypothetical protein